MTDIYQYLGLKRDLFDHFALQASLVVDNRLRSDLERHTRVLTKITERHLIDSDTVASKDSVDKVLLKLKRLSRLHDEMHDWSAFELRIISYNLSLLEGSDDTFRYAVKLLESYWKDIFINGLTFYVLNNWLTQNVTQKDVVCELLKRRLMEYDGHNQRFLALKDHANYFEENGPLRIATLLLQKDIPIQKAPEILGYKEASISFSYFSDVILCYFYRKGTIETQQLEEVLTYHSLDRTKKLSLALLVDLAEKEGSELVQTQVCKFAQRVLGDIALSSTWAPFPKASKEEVERLRHAQAIVNQWNARKAINTFFELCVQDVTRKEFWLKYVNYIDDFRIAGSKAVNTKLLGDERIKDIISYYFLKTNSQSGRTSALILFVQEKVFIEFSDSGAIYVYEKEHWKVKGLRTQKKVSSIEDLKATYFDKLVENYGVKDYIYDNNDYYYYKEVDLTKFNDEGKMFHIGHWDERLHAWIKAKLKIDYMKPHSTMYSGSSFEYKDLFSSNNEDNSLNRVPYAKLHADIVSKWLFENKCRVAANRKGFYLLVKSSFYAFALTQYERNRGGSIYVKKGNTDNDKVIWFAQEGRNDTIIGYLHYGVNHVIFREQQSDKTMRIYL